MIEIDEVVSDVKFPAEVLLAKVKPNSSLTNEEAEEYIHGLKKASEESVDALKEYCRLYETLYCGRTVFNLKRFSNINWENFRERIF